MLKVPLSRLSAIVGALTAVGVGAAFAMTGGAMFSPGELHAGDASRERYGNVASHAELAGQCSACHAPVGSARPMATRCLECHTDIQQELRVTTSLHGTIADVRRCMACHTDHQGATGSLTNAASFRDAHNRLGFALTAHVRLSSGAPFRCASCHEAASFKFEALRCVSCHKEYQAAFVVTHIKAWGSDCQSCHDGRDRFSRGAFSHDKTTYPLTGAHVRASCVSCHVGVTQLAEFTRAPQACSSCHARDDKHNGTLGTDCAACHTTSTWRGAKFEHAVFPVDHGRRGASSCATCHPNARDYKQYTCYGCHEHSPARVQAQHRGEVRTTNLDNCLACHSGGRREGGEGGEREEGEGRRRREH